jgi:hypothetical protein
MKTLILNLVFLNPFIGIIEMWQGFPNQNNILLAYYVIHIALISQHNVRLGYKPSSITKFEWKLFSWFPPWCMKFG